LRDPRENHYLLRYDHLGPVLAEVQVNGLYATLHQGDEAGTVWLAESTWDAHGGGGTSAVRVTDPVATSITGDVLLACGLLPARAARMSVDVGRHGLGWATSGRAWLVAIKPLRPPLVLHARAWDEQEAIVLDEIVDCPWPPEPLLRRVRGRVRGAIRRRWTSRMPKGKTTYGPEIHPRGR